MERSAFSIRIASRHHLLQERIEVDFGGNVRHHVQELHLLRRVRSMRSMNWLPRSAIAAWLVMASSSARSSCREVAAPLVQGLGHADDRPLRGAHGGARKRMGSRTRCARRCRGLKRGSE